ncbi:glycosyltransferase family 39 protein [candidate division WOR-3 bacterium]|nr:glycosyltransferase family 39 protein [candidate division WOR-3 bacterium]
MRRQFCILLILIISLAIITQVVWLKIDACPPAYDEAAYLERSLKMFSALKSSPLEFLQSLLGVGKYSSSYHPHRVLLPITTMPFYLLFGKSVDTGVMANAVYIIILLCSIYGIGKRLFNEKVGLFAAFLLSTFPLFCSMSRVFMAELSATSLAALSVYLLIRANYFKNRGFSILLGISLGLGMLTKELYLVAISGPLIYAICKSNLIHNRFSLRNVIISILLGALIASVWYIPNFKIIYSHACWDAFSREMGELFQVPTKFGFKFLGFYAIVGINYYGISFFYSLVFCLSLFLFCKLRGFKNQRWLLVIWLVVSYIILTLTWEKDHIYALIFFPPIALIASTGIMVGIHSPKIRRAVVSIVVLIGLLQFFDYSFNLGLLSKGTRWSPLRSKIIPGLFFRTSYKSHPWKENWKTEEILDFIIHDKQSIFPNKKVCAIRIVPDCPYISWIVFSYYINLRNLPLEVKKGDPQFMKYIDYENLLKGCDYVVTKTGEQGEGDWDRAFMIEYAQKIMGQIKKSSFKKLDKEFLLPDGSTAHIYRRPI